MVRKLQRNSKPSALPILRPNAAGIDIGADEIFVCVPPGRDPQGSDVRSFATFTQDLYSLARWLKDCGVDTVAMESTSVYWIPLFQILEAEGFEVFLVNAKHIKNVPGRKTDVKDCQWIQFLHSVGLLQGSYRPAHDICAIRTILRHRDSLVKSKACHVLRMQKSLDQMNLKLHRVISDITGLSGLRVIDAILNGERDPSTLALLCSKRIKSSKDVIAKSLVGDYLPEHLFTLRQNLEAYRNFQKQIEEAEFEVRRLLDQFHSDVNPLEDHDHNNPDSTSSAPNLQSQLTQAFGVDLTRIPGLGLITVQTIFGEVGPDFSKFSSPGAFASWLTLCPNNKISGGKVLSKQTRKTKSRTAAALRVAAQSLYGDKSALGQFYRRTKARLGPYKAITASAHRIARLIYHLVTTQQEFDETKFAAHQLCDQNRQLSRVRANAKRLGFDLTPLPQLA